MFLWHFPLAYANWVLPSALPCGARTFLSPIRESDHLGYSRARIITLFPRFHSAVLFLFVIRYNRLDGNNRASQREGVG